MYVCVDRSHDNTLFVLHVRPCICVVSPPPTYMYNPKRLHDYDDRYDDRYDGHDYNQQKAEKDEEKEGEKSLNVVVAGPKMDSDAGWLAAGSGGSIARSSSVASGDGLEENAKSTGGLAAMVRFAAARITSCKYVVNS